MVVRRPHRIARHLEEWAVLHGLVLGELISCGLSSHGLMSSHGLIPCPLVPRGLVSHGLVSRGLLPRGHTDSIPYLVAASPRSPRLLSRGHLTSAPPSPNLLLSKGRRLEGSLLIHCDSPTFTNVTCKDPLSKEGHILRLPLNWGAQDPSQDIFFLTPGV